MAEDNFYLAGALATVERNIYIHQSLRAEEGVSRFFADPLSYFSLTFPKNRAKVKIDNV